MALCKHCSTPVRSTTDAFCCRGCESVYQLIHQDGLGLFYDLKAGDPLTPMRERPFQQKDWSWLIESSEAQNDQAVGSLTVGLSGMSCMACVWLVETVAKKQAGVIETCADNSQGSFEFSYQVETCDLTELADTLHKLGYDLLPKKLGKQAGTTDSLVVRLGICGALAMNTMAFTLPRYNGMETTDELSSLLTTVVIASSTLTLLIGGSYFFKRAWSALRLGGIHMDLPISLGLILSYFGSLIGWASGHEDLFYFDFVAIFTFLMLLGKQLQISTLNKANSRFQTDSTLPEFYKNSDGDELDTTAIPADSHLMIPPGTVVPVDARLLSESADISLAWITGEPSSQLFQHTAAIPAGKQPLSAKATGPAQTTAQDITQVQSTGSRQGDPGAATDQPVPTPPATQSMKVDLHSTAADHCFHTRQGGVFYLLNFLNRPAMQTIMGDYWQDIANGWIRLYRVAERLQLDVQDPVARFLAQQLGFDHSDALQSLPREQRGSS